MAEPHLTRDELETIVRRANESAKKAGDPSMRTALQLLAEAAGNVARKLPANRTAEEPPPAAD